MPILLLARLMAAALAAPPSGAPTATVYKCTGEAGAVIYQDSPCAPGAELRNFSIDPPTLSVVPGTPGPGAKPPSARPERAAPAEQRRSPGGNAADRRFIQLGMSEAEVIQRIGKPDVDARNQRGPGQRWSYLPKDGDPKTITTLTLIDGKVADVERKMVP